MARRCNAVLASRYENLMHGGSSLRHERYPAPLSDVKRGHTLDYGGPPTLLHHTINVEGVRAAPAGPEGEMVEWWRVDSGEWWRGYEGEFMGRGLRTPGPSAVMAK
ncbi:hypothetical protein E2C01_088475 [Portunus trituberculatus]|uniref:Uncharacterized protein n=1 Tax=Portunus trituberculatus TaxID=210409 RepID=A0A5B7J9C7_PORTR|nr:hypothetical protein [Portunus trituberculatus]